MSPVWILFLLLVGTNARIAVYTNNLPVVEVTKNVNDILEKNVSKSANNEVDFEYDSSDNIEDNIISSISSQNINTSTNNKTRNQQNATTVDVIDLKNGTKVNIIDETDSENPSEKVNGVLLLTPYIEKNRIEEGVKASEVNASLFLGIKSYSGYLTVNKTYNSNMFFWYFPVQNSPVENSPWIIWLQGGPGVTSTTGLFLEIGPLKINRTTLKLEKNNYSWNRNHSLIFIDNPVGTGFSFSEDDRGYSTNMESYTENLYRCVYQLIKLFPELQVTPLYIAGESYAGKYVPALATEIYRRRGLGDITINLQGLILGNAFIDPTILNSNTFVEPLYYFGLTSPENKEFLNNTLKSLGNDTKHMFHTYIREIKSKTKQHNIYNYVSNDVEELHNVVEYFFNNFTEYKTAIHTGNRYFRSLNNIVAIELKDDFSTSTKHLCEELLEHYKILAYCGNFDLKLPCTILSENYRTWKWSGYAKFINATREPYFLNRKLVGFHKTGGRFTEATFLEAGHIVPMDIPFSMQHYITCWTHGLNVPKKKYKLGTQVILTSNVSKNESLPMSNSTFDSTHKANINPTSLLTSNGKPYLTPNNTLNVDPSNSSSGEFSKNVNKISLNSHQLTNLHDIFKENKYNVLCNLIMEKVPKEIKKSITESTKETICTFVIENMTKTSFSIKYYNNSLAVTINNSTIVIELDSSEDIVNNGTQLKLTPFIEGGRIDDGVKASEVDSKLFLGIKSYSGLLTVNETYDSQMFFWYFPVENKPKEKTPCMIWLQGGPGVSSLVGVFEEIGPFKINLSDDTLEKNPYSWHQNHSIIFIDNPIGTGFSYTNNSEGHSTDMESYTENLYRCVYQLLKLFPELAVVPLYLAGESYAGKYVPALATEIHRRRTLGDINVNLQGVILGNALIEPKVLNKMIFPFYYFGLIGPEELKKLQPHQQKLNEQLLKPQSSQPRIVWLELLTNLLNLTHIAHAYNFRQNTLNIGKFINYIMKPEVLQALHVTNQFVIFNMNATEELSQDFHVTVKDKLELILEHYDVLLYCGQFDMMVPCAPASEFYRTLQWSERDSFIRAPRFPVFQNNDIAGYCKSGGRFNEVMIRNAGHMAGSDSPKFVQDLVTKFTRRKDNLCTTSYDSVLLVEPAESKNATHDIDDTMNEITTNEISMNTNTATLNVTVSTTAVNKDVN